MGFVDRAAELSGLDRDLVIHKELQQQAAFQAEMREVFIKADVDKSGSITWDEFKDYVRDPDVRAYLATQQLDAMDAQQIFNILSGADAGQDDEEDVIKLEEFIM